MSRSVPDCICSAALWLVPALNCLQNSMMLICACPSAGPTGGAGVALPAAICSFTDPVAFLAIIRSLEPSCRRSLGQFLFHLAEFQLHRGRAAENRHHNFDCLPVFVDIVDNTVK